MKFGNYLVTKSAHSTATTANFGISNDTRMSIVSIAARMDGSTISTWTKTGSWKNWKFDGSTKRQIAMCCARSPACVLVLKQRLSSGLGEHCRYLPTALHSRCADDMLDECYLSLSVYKR